MKIKIIIFLSIFYVHATYSQSSKDTLLEKDINALVEEMEFMYGYDQTMREYTLYKTFDKSETDFIEKLPDSVRMEEMKKRRLVTDTLNRYIFEKYINPMDALHTERIITITKKYGFPSKKRIARCYKKEFNDPEFNPLILLIHSPRQYWEDLKILMLEEYQNGIINQCEYGYLLWQFTGRESFQPMLDNGYELVEENGKTILKPTCE